VRRLRTAAAVVLAATVAGSAGGCALTGSDNSAKSSSKGGTVVADYMQSGTYDKAAEQQSKAFAADPASGGAKARILAFPYAQLRQYNTTDLVSGTCKTDVMSGSYYLAPVYDKFRALTKFVKRDGYGKGLVGGLWKASEYNNGQRIGIPYGADSYSVMYRTDLFKAAGLAPPRTWTEFVSALRKLKSQNADVAPFVFAAGAPEQVVAMLFAGYDSYFMDASGKYALDPVAAEKAIELGRTLLSFAPKNVNGLSIDQANAEFLKGRAATMYGFPSFIGKDANDPSTSKVAGKWAVMPNPQPGFTWLSLWQHYIPKCTKKAEQAWRWMKFGSTPERDKANFEKYGIGPVYASTYDDPKIREQYGNWLDGQKQNLEIAKNPPLTGEAQDYLASTLGQVFTGRLSAKEAVAQVNKRWSTFKVPPTLQQAAERNGLVGGG
jgi:multiple sugar transport system substrate-binding protein